MLLVPMSWYLLSHDGWEGTHWSCWRVIVLLEWNLPGLMVKNCCASRAATSLWSNISSLWLLWSAAMVLDFCPCLHFVTSHTVPDITNISAQLLFTAFTTFCSWHWESCLSSSLCLVMAVLTAWTASVHSCNHHWFGLAPGGFLCVMCIEHAVSMAVWREMAALLISMGEERSSHNSGKDRLMVAAHPHFSSSPRLSLYVWRGWRRVRVGCALSDHWVQIPVWSNLRLASQLSVGGVKVKVREAAMLCLMRSSVLGCSSSLPLCVMSP